ncbi:MAG: competence/damage-inducible protein A, partial [Phycisphaeraceae bacterium]|nr:competence/damage-inducible protein A [Phycisphaeraceae bacterium]
MQSAAILIIGDEILSGEIVDENGPFMLHALNEAGVRVRRVVTVPDQTDVIVSELRSLRAVADAVILPGGVGPTHDDVTRCSVAEALGVELVTCAEA